MKKTILDTGTCKIMQEKEGIVVYMKLKNGGWLKNNPHTPDLQGLIGALTLSIDVLAGKVWPQQVVSSPEGNIHQNVADNHQGLVDMSNVSFLGDGGEV